MSLDTPTPTKKRGLWAAIILIVVLALGYLVFGTGDDSDGSAPDSTTQQ
jgi:hypothetical protein